MSDATLTTCWTEFGNADGSFTVEKLWYFIPEDTSQRRFLGLVADTTEERAMEIARKIAAATGHGVRRMA